MPIVQNNTEYTTKSNTDSTTQSSNTENSSYNVDQTLYRPLSEPPRFSVNHSRPNEEKPAIPECQPSNERDIPGCSETTNPDILVFPDP